LSVQKRGKHGIRKPKFRRRERVNFAKRGRKKKRRKHCRRKSMGEQVPYRQGWNLVQKDRNNAGGKRRGEKRVGANGINILAGGHKRKDGGVHPSVKAAEKEEEHRMTKGNHPKGGPGGPKMEERSGKPIA